VILELIDAARLVLLGAIAWAAAIGAAAAFVLALVAFCVGPLIAPATRAPRNTLSGRLRAENPKNAPRATRSAPSASRARTATRVPSWAHTEPYTYEDAA
jgi:hypothetical protein